MDEIQKRIKSFKQWVIFYHAMVMVDLLFGQYSMVEKNFMTLGISKLILIVMAGIFLVKIYKVAVLLRQDGLLGMAPGLLLLIQVILNLTVTSVIIPLFLWSKLDQYSRKNGLPVTDIDSRRPTGVTILTGWMIYSGISSLIIFVTPVINSFMEAVSPLEVGYMILHGVLYIILGYYLWQLRDWARMLTMAMAFFSLIWMGAYMLPPQYKPFKALSWEHSEKKAMQILEKQIRESSTNEVAKEEALENMEGQYTKILRWTKLWAVGGTCVWFGIVTFYFTRPKIKEQFS